MKIKGKSKDNFEYFRDILPKSNKQRLKFIDLIVRACVNCLDLNYRKLANAMNTTVSSSANYRRIQRFMASYSICQRVLARWIVSRISSDPDSRLTLSMDRTNWKFGKANINYLVLAVCYKGMAIPLFWTLLDKQGNSSTEERINIVNQFISTFGAYRIDYLLADREFIGKHWQSWLIQQQIPFYIRIRNDAKVKHKGREIKASKLFSRQEVGTELHKTGIVEVYGTEVNISGKKILGRKGETDYVIVISYFESRQSIKKYSMRWQIEHLFRALKSSGFNMESTHVTDPKRLETILSLITIAFFWAYKTGEWLLNKGIEKIRIKKHGRREKSIFRIGLDYINRIVSTDYKPNRQSIYHVLSCT